MGAEIIISGLMAAILDFQPPVWWWFVEILNKICYFAVQILCLTCIAEIELFNVNNSRKYSNFLFAAANSDNLTSIDGNRFYHSIAQPYLGKVTKAHYTQLQAIRKWLYKICLWVILPPFPDYRLRVKSVDNATDSKTIFTNQSPTWKHGNVYSYWVLITTYVI